MYIYICIFKYIYICVYVYVHMHIALILPPGFKKNTGWVPKFVGPIWHQFAHVLASSVVQPVDTGGLYGHLTHLWTNLPVISTDKPIYRM